MNKFKVSIEIPPNLSIQTKQIQSRVIYIIEFQFPCPRFPGTRTELRSATYKGVQAVAKIFIDP